LSSEASSAQPVDTGANHSPQALQQLEQGTAKRSDALEKEMESVRRALAAAPARAKSDLNAKLLELQGELAMVKAQKNLFDTMSQFVNETDAQRPGVSALKSRIEAIAAPIPAATSTAATTPLAAAAPAGSSTPLPAPAATAAAAASAAAPRTLGIWDLFAAAF